MQPGVGVIQELGIFIFNKDAGGTERSKSYHSERHCPVRVSQERRMGGYVGSPHSDLISVQRVSAFALFGCSFTRITGKSREL